MAPGGAVTDRAPGVGAPGTTRGRRDTSPPCQYGERSESFVPLSYCVLGPYHGIPPFTLIPTYTGLNT